MDNTTRNEISYFASGSNHEGEIAGLADCGMNVGVAVDRVNGASMAALKALAGTGTKVFVDSGAFSEIEFPKNAPPRVAKPITHSQWIERLETYVELAAHLGSQLYVVAPDKVAFQSETLERMARYRHYMLACRVLGANVLVPHQKGELTMAQFGEAAAQALGFSDWLPAIPMKKDATTQAELVDYLETAQPHAVHLLGRGPQSPGWEKLVRAVRTHSPSTIFCDSVLVASLVGRSNGRVMPATGTKGPRVLTAAFDAVNSELEEGMWSSTGGHDYTDQIFLDASEWVAELTAAQRTELAEELTLVAGEAPQGNLVDWLEDNGNDYTDQVLDHYYRTWVLETGAVAWRKRDAINLALRGQPAPERELNLNTTTRTKPVQLTLALAA